MDSKCLRSLPCRAGSERLSSVSARNVSLPRVAPTAMMGVALVAKDDAGRIGHSSSSGIGREQLGSLLGSSGRVKSLDNSRVRRKRFVGRSSFGRTRQSTDEIHSWKDGSDTPLEPISGKVRGAFYQMCRDLGSERGHDSSLLGSSRRSVVRCALANPLVDGNSKTRQMAQREKCQRNTLGCSRRPRSCRQPRESMDNW